MWFERNPLIEVAAYPSAFGISPPICGVIGLLLFAPAPGLCGPEFAASVAAVFNKLQKFRLGHRRPGYSKCGPSHTVSPFFIVEDETVSGRRSYDVGPAGNRDIAGDRSIGAKTVVYASGRRKLWGAILQCLASNRERFVVHVLMKNGQQDEVDISIIQAGSGDPFQNLVSHRFQILNCGATRSKWKAPSSIML